MLNATQERIRCNGLVIIPWWNTIPFQELIGDHFGVGLREMRIISGSVSFRGRIGDHLRVGEHFGVGIISGAAVQAWKKYPFRAKLPRPV